VKENGENGSMTERGAFSERGACTPSIYQVKEKKYYDLFKKIKN